LFALSPSQRRDTKAAHYRQSQYTLQQHTTAHNTNKTREGKMTERNNIFTGSSQSARDLIHRKWTSQWGCSSQELRHYNTGNARNKCTCNKNDCCNCSMNNDIKVNIKRHVSSEAEDGLELHRRIARTRNDDWPPCQSWTPVLDRIRESPHEVHSLDRRGRTSLMACMAKASFVPQTVLQALVEATKFGMETARDKTGLTALMIALQVQAPIESIRVLLRKNSRGQVITCDHQGNLPLHMALQRSRRERLLSDDREWRCEVVELLLSSASSVPSRDHLATMDGQYACQVATENNVGKTPVHVAIENRMPLEVVQPLVEGESHAALYSNVM
jgi:hypothetical protein